MEYVLDETQSPYPNTKNAKPVRYHIDTSGCHVCTSHKPNGKGYPLKSLNNSYTSMARYVWSLHGKREPTDDEYLLHNCGNRQCINVSHLFIGQKKDLIDMKRKEGKLVRYTDLTEEQIIAIKKDVIHSSPELARKHGVSVTTIHDIWNERNFAYLKVRNYPAICQKRKDRGRKSKAKTTTSAKGRLKNE